MNPPPIPYENAILEALKRLLEGISTSNGYHTNAGQHVFLADEREAPAADQESIVLIVHDGEEELVKQDGYVRDVRLRVDVECFVPVPRTPGGRSEVRNTTRMVLTDVRRAVLQALKGGSMKPDPIDLTCDGRTIMPMDEGGTWMVAVQPVLVGMREEFQSV